MVTGRDYAQAGMVDATTIFGMRIALFGAVNAWHASEIKNQETALHIIREHVLDNNFLKAAGTHEIVANFYEDIMTRDGADVVAFANAIPPIDITSIEKFILSQNGKLSGEAIGNIILSELTGANKNELIKTAALFTKSAKEHLQLDQSLTESFIEALPSLAKDVTITPTALSEQDRLFLANLDGVFRDLDTLDAKRNKNNNEVQGLIAPPPRTAFEALGITDSKSLDFGEVNPAIQTIMNANFGMTTAANEQRIEAQHEPQAKGSPPEPEQIANEDGVITGGGSTAILGNSDGQAMETIETDTVQSQSAEEAAANGVIEKDDGTGVADNKEVEDSVEAPAFKMKDFITAMKEFSTGADDGKSANDPELVKNIRTSLGISSDIKISNPDVASTGRSDFLTGKAYDEFMNVVIEAAEDGITEEEALSTIKAAAEKLQLTRDGEGTDNIAGQNTPDVRQSNKNAVAKL